MIADSHRTSTSQGQRSWCEHKYYILFYRNVSLTCKIKIDSTNCTVYCNKWTDPWGSTRKKRTHPGCTSSPAPCTSQQHRPVAPGSAPVACSAIRWFCLRWFCNWNTSSTSPTTTTTTSRTTSAPGWCWFGGYLQSYESTFKICRHLSTSEL